MYFTSKEAVDNYKEASKAKAALPFGKLWVKSMLAGMMIAMGAAGSNVAAHAISNVGLARLTAAVVFPVGLMMVILMGAELFTGDCLMAMALPEKKITFGQFVKVLVGGYFGNWVGAALLAAAAYISGQFNYTNGLLGAYTIKVALGKTSLDFGTAFVSGILCNILVCAAVLMAGCAKDISGKLLVSFFVIMLFVTSGFEHCVANMYYITAGLIAKLNSQYVEVAMSSYGFTEAQLATLNIKTFVIDNLVPVTLGNIAGGSVLFGLAMYFTTRDSKK